MSITPFAGLMEKPGAIAVFPAGRPKAIVPAIITRPIPLSDNLSIIDPPGWLVRFPLNQGRLIFITSSFLSLVAT
jgi:hypothetical protein